MNQRKISIPMMDYASRFQQRSWSIRPTLLRVLSIAVNFEAVLGILHEQDRGWKSVPTDLR